eukprot:scaffold45566_cov34-Prasinocladus_malaysianus.AAC.1
MEFVRIVGYCLGGKKSISAAILESFFPTLDVPLCCPVIIPKPAKMRLSTAEAARPRDYPVLSCGGAITLPNLSGPLSAAARQLATTNRAFR